MMEGFGEIMTFEETPKCLKTGKSTLYKMAREGKIPTVKIELRRNNKVIIRLPYNQELVGYKSSKTTEIYTHVSKAKPCKNKKSTGQYYGGIDMISDRGMNIRNTSHILPIWRYIRNIAYMNELGVMANKWRG